MEFRRLIRSHNSERSMHVTFTNASSRHVDVFWVDFNGRLVRYFYRIPPRTYKEIITYETHPWVARDSDTGLRLCLSGDYVYIAKIQRRPNAEEEEDAEEVDERNVELCLHTPVYRLEEICVDFFRQKLNKDAMSKLEVSKYIMDKLCFDPQPPISIYQHPLQVRQN